MPNKIVVEITLSDKDLDEWVELVISECHAGRMKMVNSDGEIVESVDDCDDNISWIDLLKKVKSLKDLDQYGTFELDSVSRNIIKGIVQEVLYQEDGIMRFMLNDVEYPEPDPMPVKKSGRTFKIKY